jgi:hypothetical protein
MSKRILVNFLIGLWFGRGEFPNNGKGGKNVRKFPVTSGFEVCETIVATLFGSRFQVVWLAVSIAVYGWFRFILATMYKPYGSSVAQSPAGLSLP